MLKAKNLISQGKRKQSRTAGQWKKDFEGGQGVGKGAGMIWRLRDEEHKKELRRRNMRKRSLE